MGSAPFFAGDFFVHAPVYRVPHVSALLLPATVATAWLLIGVVSSIVKSFTCGVGNRRAHAAHALLGMVFLTLAASVIRVLSRMW